MPENANANTAISRQFGELWLDIKEDDEVPAPLISRLLYKKATEHNDQLAKMERLLLLSRCDVVGKALAYPDALTETQRNLVLGRPPPALLTANIKEVTDNAMSSIAELQAADLRALSYLALECIVLNYWTHESHDFFVDDLAVWSDGGNHSSNAALQLLTQPVDLDFQNATIMIWAEDATMARQKRLWDAEYDDDPRPAWEISQASRLAREEKEPLVQETVREYWLEQGRLREELKAQVRVEQAAMTEADAVAMKRLKEQMQAEVAQEPVEDALEAERVAVGQKRAREEEDEEKRRKRSKRKRPCRKQTRMTTILT